MGYDTCPHLRQSFPTFGDNHGRLNARPHETPTPTACLPPQTGRGPIHPYTFADRMRTHWETLGNVYSPALGRLWLTMGETFNAAIAGNPGQRRFVCVDESLSNLIEEY